MNTYSIPALIYNICLWFFNLFVSSGLSYLIAFFVFSLTLKIFYDIICNQFN